MLTSNFAQRTDLLELTFLITCSAKQKLYKLKCSND